MDQSDLSGALTFAHGLADLAASVTLPAFGARQSVIVKPDGTPVTEADAAAERVVRAAVARAHPDDGFLGEEEGASGPAGGRVWIADPIDGTKHYADGVPLWSTLIALQDADGVQVAVVDMPAMGERYHATRSGGAWHGTERLHVSGVAALPDACVLHSGIEEWVAGGRLDALVRVAAGARRTRGLSDAWGHILVAQGSAEVLLEHEPCGAWDYTAPCLVVEEAGGRVSSLSGGPLAPGCDLLVTNGRVHDEVLETLLHAVTSM